MKHIIFSLSIAVLVLFCSCEVWNRRETNNHYIINQSNKEIVHILYTDHPLIKEDSLVFQISSISDTILEWKISEIVGFGEDVKEFDYNGFCVYNLTDTTLFRWNGYFGSTEINTETFSGFFSKGSVSTLSNNKLRETEWVTNYYLTVNDQLLSLMEKDYSMLERFKEYYQK